MKLIPILSLFLLAIVSSPAQQVFINPASVTLTRQGAVTVIVSDPISSSDTDTAAVGGIQASSSLGSYSSSQGASVTLSNGAASGTLDAGTYPVEINGNPQQVTVILWNEPSNGVSVSQVELVNTSATTADQIWFQAFVASQAQQQIAVLHIQIDSLRQNGEYTDLMSAEQQLVNVQSVYDELTNSLTITAVVTARNGQDGATGPSGRSADNTLAYAGMGIGAAAFIGTMVNFFVGDDSKGESQSNDAPAPSVSK